MTPSEPGPASSLPLNLSHTHFWTMGDSITHRTRSTQSQATGGFCAHSGRMPRPGCQSPWGSSSTLHCQWDRQSGPGPQAPGRQGLWAHCSPPFKMLLDHSPQNSWDLSSGKGACRAGQETHRRGVLEGWVRRRPRLWDRLWDLS